ncbi:MAG: hypothetical protein ACRELF_29630 [Gemmataceae bacterium]
MLDIILAHWAMYLYVPLMIVLAVLFIVYRDRSAIVYRRLRRLPQRTRLMVPRWRLRPRTLR